MHHPLPRKEVFLGTAQVTPARKFKFPLWPLLTFYKENDAGFQNHGCIWSTNCFPWHSCSIQRGKVQELCSLSSCQKKNILTSRARKELFKTRYYIHYLHFASPPALLVHVYKLKDFFYPLSEVINYSLHYLPCESRKVYKQILIHTCQRLHHCHLIIV